MMNTDEAIAFAKKIPSLTMNGPIPAETTHALAAALVSVSEELEEYRSTNESIATCAAHTQDMLWTERIPCLVCHIAELEDFKEQTDYV